MAVSHSGLSTRSRQRPRRITFNPARVSFAGDDSKRVVVHFAVLVDDTKGVAVGELTRTVELALSGRELANAKNQWIEFDVLVPFTGNPRETHDTLRQLQDLMRHAIPDGDPSRIIDRALTLLLHDVLRQKCGSSKNPRVGSVESSDSRAIPATQCAVRSGLGTGDDVHSLARMANARRRRSWSITIASRLRPAAKRRRHNAYEAKLFFTSDVARESDVDSFWNERHL